MTAIATDSPFVLLHRDDDVVVARRAAPQGTVLNGPNGLKVTCKERIDLGHKLAIRAVASGGPVRKYGQLIGYATRDIAPGDWVHQHNLGLGVLSHDYDYCTDIPPAPVAAVKRTFEGYRRADGRVGTRNYIAIVSTVNCSAASSKFISQKFDEAILEQFPNVDGVIPLIHKGGCAMEFGGPDHRQLARTLAGFARHPNIAGYLIVGLGCETSQASFLTGEYDLVQLGNLGSPGKSAPAPITMNIQDEGGVAKTVARGVSILKEMLPEVNKLKRETISAGELMLGLNCGGSDGNSGITANPALGYASDLLVAQGGTAVLAETPEIYGAEQVLIRRAINRGVADKLVERIRWWEDYAAKFNASIDNNPSVGNKKGGLTTIYEKSLGAVAKGGSTALRGVYEYSEQVKEKGLVVMDTPGYDPASVTGIVAGGCQVVVFTTGRGSVLGCKPSPTIKVSTNTPLFERMRDDMDLDAGPILNGKSIEEVGTEIFEEVLAVASGKQTKSEAQGIGDEEFCPWTAGPVF